MFATISNRQLFLTLNGKAKVNKFVCQTRFISGLKETRAEFSMNGNCRPNDSFSDFI